MAAGATPPADGSALLLSMRRMNRIRSIERREPARGRRGGRGPRDAARGRARDRHALPADARRARQLHDRRPDLDQRRRHAGAEVRDDARRSSRASKRCCPTARIHNGLSGLKKDNRGYSLDQLLIGAEGTLGVVTAVALRLVPAIAARAVAWAGVDSPARALDLLRFLEARTNSVEGFELVPQDSLELVLKHIPGTRAAARRRAPLARAGRSDHRRCRRTTSAAELERLLGAALEQGIIGDAVIAASEAQAEAFWKIRDSHLRGRARRRADAGARHFGRRSPTCRASSSTPRREVERAFPGVDRQRLRPSRRRQHPFPRPRRQPRRARTGTKREGDDDHALRRRSGHRRGRLDLGRARHRPAEARRVRPPRAARPHPCAARDQAGARPARHHEPGEADPLTDGSRRDFDSAQRSLAARAAGVVVCRTPLLEVRDLPRWASRLVDWPRSPRLSRLRSGLCAFCRVCRRTLPRPGHTARDLWPFTPCP